MPGRVVDYHRAQFCAAIQIISETCVEIMRNVPRASVEYGTAEALLRRLDEALLSLTGDRKVVGETPHDGSVPVAPLERARARRRKK